MILGFDFLTSADLLMGTSGVVKVPTAKDVSLLEIHVEFRSATPLVVAPPAVDVTRSGEWYLDWQREQFG